MKIAIIGAGLTGLVAGYRLSQKGHRVTIFEKGNDIGGLMGGFKIGNTSLEKAYHHIFQSDNYIIDLVKELGLLEKLKWYDESMAIVYHGEKYKFVTPIDLFKFKPLNIVDKLRLGLVMVWLKKDNNWKKYESQLAYQWMKKWCGEKAYRVIWEPLLRGKFHDKYREVSMAWLWARIHTRGNSGKLGYFEGGFRIMADELAKRIKENNGVIKLGQNIIPSRLLRRKTPRNDVGGYDKIIYTGPSKEIDYLGAVCVVFTSNQSLSKFYWHNINDTKSPFVAFIQHTNLIDKKTYDNKHVYYMGTYVPNEGELMKKDDKQIKREFFDYLKKIFPKFSEKEIEENWVFKFKNAQHVVSTKYKVPSTKLGKNVYQSNFAQIYPEDRGTNFAVREGNKVAELISKL